jgi:uncharacterized protein YciI
MLYALICTDKPDSGDLRQMVRPAHLAYLEGLGTALKAAGPFTDEEGKPMGSLVIVEAEDRAEAGKIADNDPYAKAGLFRSVEIRGWKWTLKNPEAA